MTRLLRMLVQSNGVLVCKLLRPSKVFIRTPLVDVCHYLYVCYTACERLGTSQQSCG